MDRRQLARECVKIEKAGGNVRDFLRRQGCISPWGTWHRLQREELGRTDAQITDGTGGKLMGQTRITDAQKKQAVRSAIAGGDPRNYLRDCGSKAPDIMWQSIRKKVMTEDPETYAKLPARIPRAEKEKQVVGLVYDPSIAEEYRREHAGDAEKFKHRQQGKNLKVTSAEGMAGKWKRAGAFLTLEIHRDDGPDDAGDMTADEWIMAAEELPAVLKLFGMEAEYGIQELCD